MQTQWHVKHHGGDRHTHEDSNPEAAEGDKPLPPPGHSFYDIS